MPFDFAGYEVEAADTLLRDLITGRERIARPEQWCKGSLGRTVDGVEVSATDRRAVAFCLMGAYMTPELGTHLHSIINSPERERLLRAYGALSEHVPGHRCVPDFNNDPATTHADVLAVYDRAIAARRKELWLA